MFGFKSKKEPKAAREEPEPVMDAEELPVTAPVLSPIELPLDGVVPDPLEEPKPEAHAAPMLDFSAPPKGPDEAEGESSSLADLFVSTEEETQSDMSAILDRVPQISIEEIMEDLAEIKEMLRGRLDNQ